MLKSGSIYTFSLAAIQNLPIPYSDFAPNVARAEFLQIIRRHSKDFYWPPAAPQGHALQAKGYLTDVSS